MVRLLCSVLVFLCVGTGIACAAEPVRDLAALRVAPDTVLHVESVNGGEIRGRFVRVSAQALTITGLDGRELSLPVELIRSVWRRGDGLRNGAILGGLFGLAGALFGQSACTDCGSEVALGVVVGVPIWAGVGALIDRGHVGRTLVYTSP